MPSKLSLKVVFILAPVFLWAIFSFFNSKILELPEEEFSLEISPNPEQDSANIDLYLSSSEKEVPQKSNLFTSFIVNRAFPFINEADSIHLLCLKNRAVYFTEPILPGEPIQSNKLLVHEIQKELKNSQIGGMEAKLALGGILIGSVYSPHNKENCEPIKISSEVLERNPSIVALTHNAPFRETDLFGKKLIASTTVHHKDSSLYIRMQTFPLLLTGITILLWLWGLLLVWLQVWKWIKED